MLRTGTTHIVIHTTASNSFATAQDIMNYFMRILRWKKGGYHTIYQRDGKPVLCYDWRTEATNGILPSPDGLIHNLNAVHLSYIGGIKDYKANEAICNITPEQEAAIITTIKEILVWYPKAKIIGHNQINQKFCPSFWVPDWARKHGFSEDNIDSRDPFNIEKAVKALPHPTNFYGASICPTCKKPL